MSKGVSPPQSVLVIALATNAGSVGHPMRVFYPRLCSPKENQADRMQELAPMVVLINMCPKRDVSLEGSWFSRRFQGDAPKVGVGFLQQKVPKTPSFCWKSKGIFCLNSRLTLFCSSEQKHVISPCSLLLPTRRALSNL